MITLNDYLYSGDTVLKILQKYTRDLRKEAKLTHNEIDMMHVNFLIQITELLEHNDFLTAQSQKIREFYKYMAHEYPFLAFTFKGRIKSLIRAEEKFNGYIVEYIYDYYTKHGTYPPVSELKNKLSCFRDFIAYRIVLCMPKCHLKPGEDQETASIRYLYEIANVLPGFLEERGFTVESAYGVKKSTSPLLNEDVKTYYRDYICGTSGEGYQSLHITVYDNSYRSFMEVKQSTQKMDGIAEIGPSNHLRYDKQQHDADDQKQNAADQVNGVLDVLLLELRAPPVQPCFDAFYQIFHLFPLLFETQKQGVGAFPSALLQPFSL